MRGIPDANKASTNCRMKPEPWPRPIISGPPMNWSMPRVAGGYTPKFQVLSA